MVVDRKQKSISHHHVRDLPQLLRPKDCLVVNDTRVIPARLVGNRVGTGGRWEGLFLNVEPSGAWQLLCKARGRLTAGETIQLFDREAREAGQLRLVAKSAEGIWLARPASDESPTELLDRIGRVPLPKYIRHGEMVDADRKRYQTVFAQHTARRRRRRRLALHRRVARAVEVGRHRIRQGHAARGAGYVSPNQTDTRLPSHAMHSEWGRIDSSYRRAIAAASQSRRTNRGRRHHVGSRAGNRRRPTACSRPWEGQTELFIRPPYRFRAVDALMTNFHLPRTTLLVLVRTFGGDELIRQAYEEAIRQEYRFYSYGDAMLIL